MVYAANPRRFEIGSVLGAMGSAIGKNGPVFFAISAIFIGLPTALFGVGRNLLINPADPGAAAQAFTGVGLALTIGSAVVTLVTTYLAEAALIHGVVSNLRGRKADFGQCLAVGAQNIVPAVLIAIITAIGVALGFILLIVPGVILALAWTVALPAAVVEKVNPIEALSRSWKLTDGHRGALFLIFLLYLALSFVFNLVFGAMGAVAAVGGIQTMLWVSGVVVQPLAQTVVSVFAAAGMAAIYFELRAVKEGFGADDLAAIFD